MAEINIAEPGDTRTARRFIAYMQQSKATIVAEKTSHSIATLEGFRTYRFPDGSTVELWTDEFSGHSLRGDPALIGKIADSFAKANGHG